MLQPLSRLLKSYLFPASPAPHKEQPRGEPVSLLERLPLAVIQNELLTHVTDAADRLALARVERALWPLVKDHVVHNHLSTVHAWLSQIVDHELPKTYAEVQTRTQAKSLPLQWGDAARATEYLLFYGPLGGIGYGKRTTPHVPLSAQQAASALNDVRDTMHRALTRYLGQPLTEVVSSQEIEATRDHLFDLREMTYLPLRLYEQSNSDSEARMLCHISRDLKNLTGRNATSWQNSYGLIGQSTFPPLHMYLPGLEEVLLQDSGLQAMPRELAHLVRLNELNLAGNAISEWAAGTPSLPQLKRLDLSKNLFTTFPQGLLASQALTVLSLSHNPIVKIDEALEPFSQLQELTASHNQINHLPKASLLRKRLKRLDVSLDPMEA